MRHIMFTNMLFVTLSGSGKKIIKTISYYLSVTAIFTVNSHMSGIELGTFLFSVSEIMPHVFSSRVYNVRKYFYNKQVLLGL